MEPFCLVHLWSNATIHVEFVRVGLSPYNAPGVFSLLAATELIDGVWYPVGDFGKVGEALAQVGSESWCRDSHKYGCVKHWSQRWEGNALWLRQVYLLKWRYQRRHCCFWFSDVLFALQLLFWVPLQLLYPLQSCCICQGLAGTQRTFFSLTLHVFWICFCNQIGIYIYVVSFFVQLQSRWLEHCCWSCKHIWEALLLLLEGMLFFCFWLNKIWDLQLRKTSYLITSSVKATPSVVELVPSNICPHSNDNCSFKHNPQSSLVSRSPFCWQICIT